MKEITAKIDISQRAIVYNGFTFYKYDLLPRPFLSEHKNTKEVRFFPTIAEAAYQLDIPSGNIRNCLDKLISSTNDYIFSYI